MRETTEKEIIYTLYGIEDGWVEGEHRQGSDQVVRAVSEALYLNNPG